MIFGRVVGSVVSTKSSQEVGGAKYLLVRVTSPRGELRQEYIVALDLVGSGTGEIVVVAQGSSSRQTNVTYQKPVDAVIAGIVDMVEEDGRVVFRK
ncbi:MAG: EutN/CcmL family microcompartment protein [Spirochaetes bacterium]|nr:EutN/CcmL family microcompartment protein [Spirochaetota bacterium]